VIERQSWNMFGLTLTDLGSAFRLDYFYYQASVLGPNFESILIDYHTGTYGFSLPGTAYLEATGPLVDRSWIFGQTQAVPEPGTWLTMLVGFAAIGFALRRHARRNQRLFGGQFSYA
jgi:hypothetical protein